MGDITNDLQISVGGTVVATDEMLADTESMAAMSSGLNLISIQLATADATLTTQTRTMSGVIRARNAMDDAWVAMTEANGICEYLSGQLAIAIENYAESERNATWLAHGVDSALSYLFGRGVAITADVFGPLTGFLVPWLVGRGFGESDDAIDAGDVTMPAFFNEWSLDPNFVSWLRNTMMTGEFFTAGLGPVPAALAADLQRQGVTGAALSGSLLMIYAQFAGMLVETPVTVTKTTTYERQGPATTSTESRIASIPDPARREDGAQVRIDEIKDGNSVRYEVFIAGTADFNPISKTEAFDFTANVAGVSGLPPASYRAVQLAMEQAGITSTSQVSLVGYSQGGLVASMLAASGDYNVKAVTTIGGPTGQIIIPSGIPALLIEHDEDLVPALGGPQSNTDAVVVTRRAFSEQHPADTSLPMPGHQLQYYLETAVLIDGAESKLLSSTVDQINDFSNGEVVTSTWYHAERTP
jgi:hypothetical protein